MNKNIKFNNKTILITGGAGFIGSNLAFYFQKNFPNSKVIVFDSFRSEAVFTNGNLQSLGHYKNLIGFNGDIICGNINNKTDLALLNNYSNLTLFFTKQQFLIHEYMIRKLLCKLISIHFLLYLNNS